MRVARRYRFSASHRLHSPLLGDEENCALYGKCNNPYGHGHDYLFEVIVNGEADVVTGLVVPAPALDALVRRTVLGDYEHRYMNAEIAVFAEVVPTTENVTKDIHRRLAEAWPASFGAAQLEGVRMWETKRNIVETGGVVKELAQ